MLGAVISQAVVIPLFQRREKFVLRASSSISFNSNKQPAEVAINSFV